MLIFSRFVRSSRDLGMRAVAIQKLSESEINARLSEVPEWGLSEGKLHRKLLFKTFSDAFGFMTRAAFFSEKKNHHPEWSNVYNRLTIDLITLEVGGITERDFAWAKASDEIYNSFSQPTESTSCC